tara:strand:- start:456 stop:851 length:396 start_codon:yes stop_codon:yes gene_type:complete
LQKDKLSKVEETMGFILDSLKAKRMPIDTFLESYLIYEEFVSRLNKLTEDDIIDSGFCEEFDNEYDYLRDLALRCERPDLYEKLGADIYYCDIEDCTSNHFMDGDITVHNLPNQKKFPYWSENIGRESKYA